MEANFSKIEERLATYEGSFSGIEGELTGIQEQLDENTQLVTALRHMAEVNTAEYNKMDNDIAHLKGEFSGLRTCYSLKWSPLETGTN